jgi:hypothetical protein
LNQNLNTKELQKYLQEDKKKTRLQITN